MDRKIEITGQEHRIALGDYYEHTEVIGATLWDLSDTELALEKKRCLDKFKKAQTYMPSLKILMRITLSIGAVLLYVWLTPGLLGNYAPIVFVPLFVFTLIIPLRKIVEETDFNRTAFQYYQERLKIIKLIEHDREE